MTATRRVAVRVVDLGGRQARGDAVDLGLAGAGHEVVVGRVVGDVAGAVGLLQPADAVLQPGRPRDRPRPRQGLRVAQVGQELAVRTVGLGGELDPQVRQARPRPGRPTARRRWPGSRRTAGSPASGRSARCARPRARRRSSRRGSAGAITGSGASPLRPNIACSRSDCSVLVGSPVDGPPRCTSTIDQRQLESSRPGRWPRTSARCPGRTSS